MAVGPCPAATLLYRPCLSCMLSVSWERGYHDLPACGPRHGSISGLVQPTICSDNSRPSRGAKPREADDTKTSPGAASLGWLPWCRDIYARGTSRGSRDVSHDDQGQASTSGRSVPVSSLVLRGQAQARSPEESSKGFHIGATRPRPAGRQDGDHHGAHDGVATRAFGRRRPPFVRITCTSCLPSKLDVVGPLPA